VRRVLKPRSASGPSAPSWLAMLEAPGRGARSLRERICGAIRDAVRAGHLRHGDRLPATRTLASDLRVSRITAEAAYAQLEAEGYVRRRVGDGTFIHIDGGYDITVTNAPVRTGSPRPHWSRRGTAIVRGGGCVEPSSAAAFSAGFPDLSEFPIDAWKRLTARRLRRDAASTMGYGDSRGEPDLRIAVASYLGQSRGVRCTADQVIVLTSSQQALHLAATMLTDPEDVVWIEEPGYRGAQTALTAMGAQLRPIRVDDEGISELPPLRRAVPRLIYTTPSHQYPTGVTLSLARRLALVERVRRSRTYILEDDYDSEFQYDARPTPAMQGLDDAGRVLYVGTFSKVLFPALRLAYLVVPPAMVDGIVTARTTHDGHAARLAQLVTADFIREGHFAAHLRRMRRLYRERRDVLLEELRRRLPWCRPFGAAAGLQLTVALPRGREVALTQAARRAGVATPGLSDLFLGRPSLDGWVLGFSALSNEAIVDGVKRLSRLRMR
jgi:GntR family transcriptional regulator / MocR family aminotransferase